jgi:hypothetical protein
MSPTSVVAMPLLMSLTTSLVAEVVMGNVFFLFLLAFFPDYNHLSMPY